MIETAPAYDYKCPACGDPGLRHREARFGKLECAACHAWVDEGPEGWVLVQKPPPPPPEDTT